MKRRKLAKVRTIEDVQSRIKATSDAVKADCGLVVYPEVLRHKGAFGYSKRAGGSASGTMYDNYEIKNEEYEFNHQILREYGFKKGQHRFIFELFTEGFTEREIADWLKFSVYPAVKSQRVGKIIREIKDDFKKNIQSKPKTMVFSPDQLKRNRDIGEIYYALELTGLRDCVGARQKEYIETMLANGKDAKFVLLSVISTLDL